MRPGWKDVSSRSKSEPHDSPPKATEMEVDPGRGRGNLRIVVHRHIDYEPTRWLMSCHPALFDIHPLEDGLDLDDAQEKAEALVEARLRRWLTELKLKGARKKEKR